VGGTNKRLPNERSAVTGTVPHGIGITADLAGGRLLPDRTRTHSLANSLKSAPTGGAEKEFQPGFTPCRPVGDTKNAPWAVASGITAGLWLQLAVYLSVF
jgi:hypothetical protein